MKSKKWLEFEYAQNLFNRDNRIKTAWLAIIFNSRVKFERWTHMMKVTKRQKLHFEIKLSYIKTVKNLLISSTTESLFLFLISLTLRRVRYLTLYTLLILRCTVAKIINSNFWSAHDCVYVLYIIGVVHVQCTVGILYIVIWRDFLLSSSSRKINPFFFAIPRTRQTNWRPWNDGIGPQSVCTWLKGIRHARALCIIIRIILKAWHWVYYYV